VGYYRSLCKRVRPMDKFDYRSEFYTTGMNRIPSGCVIKGFNFGWLMIRYG